MTKTQQIIDALKSGRATKCTHTGRPALKVQIDIGNTITEIYLLNDDPQPESPEAIDA